MSHPGAFRNKVVLITGAAGGFGARLAERMSAEGAKLVLSDFDSDRLTALTGKLDGEHATLSGDIADETLSEALVRLAFDRFGGLDVAVNNAGIAQSFVRLPQVPSDEARNILEVDLLAVFYAMKHQIPVMERQFRQSARRGAIVNVASVAGLAGAPRLSVYAAAKHGVVGLTRSAAAEYATKGIRINAVCPSFARTPMVDGFVRTSLVSEEEAIDGLTRGVPMRRLAEIDEVLEAILFAADPANAFMTGQALAIDGGITAI